MILQWSPTLSSLLYTGGLVPRSSSSQQTHSSVPLLFMLCSAGFFIVVICWFRDHKTLGSLLLIARSMKEGTFIP